MRQQEQLSFNKRCQRTSLVLSTPSDSSRTRSSGPSAGRHVQDLGPEDPEEPLLQERSQPGRVAREGCGQERGREEEVQVP